MNRPREFTVASNGRVLRHRMGHYDRATGDLLQLEEEVENGRIRVTDLEYEANGNIKRVIGPANERGQRYTVDFTYDQEVSTCITAITDSFGYQSTAAYDYRYGVETVTVDLNGNTMRKEYDDFGRLRRVFGPYDQLIPAVDFTYYHTELPARAVTKNKVHFDSDNAETLVTVLFIDGLKRVIQTKKEGEVQETGAFGSSYGMNVTGKVSFDAFGRMVEQGQPVFTRGYDEQWADVAMKNPTRNRV